MSNKFDTSVSIAAKLLSWHVSGDGLHEPVEVVNVVVSSHVLPSVPTQCLVVQLSPYQPRGYKRWVVQWITGVATISRARVEIGRFVHVLNEQK